MAVEEHFAEIGLKILVLLVVAVVAREVFNRLGQSPVLGELTAGVVFGPAVIGFFHPGENEIITFLAFLGLALLLFKVGLETSLAKFGKVFLPSVSVAVIGVFLPFAFGYIAIFLWFRDAILAMFVGATLTATSIGITARLLAELHRLHSAEGNVILGAAIVDDIIGLVLLSVMLGAAKGSAFSILGLGYTIGLAVLFLAAVLVYGTRLTPFLMRFVRQMKSSGSLEVLAFSLCVGIAVLAAKVGLAFIVGAFLAGLILEKVEEREHIMNRMEPLMDIFVPLYFVSAGAMLNPRALSSLGDGAILLVILAIALGGKLASGFGAPRFSLREKIFIGAGMVPRGEVGLVFATSGLLVGVFDARWYAILLVAIILTMFVTPLFLRFLAAEEKTKKDGT